MIFEDKKMEPYFLVPVHSTNFQSLLVATMFHEEYFLLFVFPHQAIKNLKNNFKLFCNFLQRFKNEWELQLTSSIRLINDRRIFSISSYLSLMIFFSVSIRAKRRCTSRRSLCNALRSPNADDNCCRISVSVVRCCNTVYKLLIINITKVGR